MGEITSGVPDDSPRHQPELLIGMSPQIGEIAAALAKAQGAMISPRRNRLVKVSSKRTGQEYSYRYSTLDTINDMIRGPLSENGVFITSVPRRTRGGNALFTRLVHGGSGQWVEAEFPLTPADVGPQAIGSAITYARRYSITALLNIASDEDDDGAVASRMDSTPYEHAAPPKPSSPQNRDKVAEIEERRLRRNFYLLLQAVDEVDQAKPDQLSPQLGIKLLKAWQAELDAFSAFRAHPDRAEPWETMQKRVPPAIARLWGEHIAKAWLHSLIAETPDEIGWVRQKWMGEWADAVRDMKKNNPTAFALLGEHMSAQGKRCEKAEQDKAELAANPPPEDEPTCPDAPPEDELDQEHQKAPPAAAAEAPQEPPAPPTPEQTYVLLDQEGKPSGEPFSNALAFARAYVALWLTAADADTRTALEEHNADTVASAAEMDRRAGEMLVELSYRGRAPHELRVIPPTNQAGSIQLAAYLSAITASLETVRVNEIPAWEEANREVYEGLPQTAKLQVYQRIARRREALGLGVSA